MQVDDARPIWIQIVDELTRRIVAGHWPPGTRIPSVRDLAAEVGVNLNTVQRALTELDRSGLTTTERTAGRFVTADDAVIDAARRELALGATSSYVTTLTGLGMSLDGASRLLAEQWPDPTPGDPS